MSSLHSPFLLCLIYLQHTLSFCFIFIFSQQDTARDSGALLWVMFLAMDAREPDMCRVAGRLCRALTDGDARSLAVLTRSFPPGLLVPSPPDQAKRCRVFLSFFSLYLTWRTGATYSGTKLFGICVGLFLVLNGLNKEKSFSFLLNWIERSLCFVFFSYVGLCFLWLDAVESSNHVIMVLVCVAVPFAEGGAASKWQVFVSAAYN